MKKIKILAALVGIMVLNNAAYLANAATPEEIKSKMTEFIVSTANLEYIDAKYTAYIDSIDSSFPLTYVDITPIVHKMREFCETEVSKENAPLIAKYFENFVYSLYSRNIPGYAQGSLNRFLLDILVGHFDMKMEDIESVDEAIKKMPKVVEHKPRPRITRTLSELGTTLK